MKIYNKKGFFAGIFWLALAFINLFNSIVEPEINNLVQFRDILFSVFLLILGINSFFRSLSIKASIEDYIEEHDEKNILVKYKSKSRMLDIVYVILFVSVIISIIGFSMDGNIVYGTILVFSGVLLSIFLIIEIFVSIYYEKKK